MGWKRSRDVYELVPALAEPSSGGQVQMQPSARREEGKICRLLEIRKPNFLLKKEIWSKLGGEELFWGCVKARLIFQAMMNQMFSCEVTYT